MTIAEIAALPVRDVAADKSHCYLWTPNALVPDAFNVLDAWGFTYKAMIVWHKVRKDGGSDGRGVGFYFRNVYRDDPVRRAGQSADVPAGATPGELARHPKARALT